MNVIQSGRGFAILFEEGLILKGSESKALASVETDLIIIKKNLDRLSRRLTIENAKTLVPDIAFTLSTASNMLSDAIDSLDLLSNRIDR